MCATTHEVAMLADVSGAYSRISSVNLCVTGPLWHQHRHSIWMYLTLIGQQNINVAAKSLRFVMDNKSRFQFINYNNIL